MSRRTVRLFVPALAFGAALSASPSIAASSPPTVDARSLSTSMVVEIIEIGRLGDSKPLIVNRRRLKGAAATRRMKFDLRKFTVSVAADDTREACFYAKPQWKRYNGYGRLSSKAWYHMEWCARAGVVSRVLTLYCGGLSGQGFGYRGCSIRRGSTGFSRVNVPGSWRFPFRIGPYTLLTRTIIVGARHYANGRYAGTWWRYQ